MSKRILFAGITLLLSIGTPSASANREVGKKHSNDPIVTFALHAANQAAKEKKPKKKSKAAARISRNASEWQQHKLRMLRKATWHAQAVMHKSQTRKLPRIKRELAKIRTEREKYGHLIRRWALIQDQAMTQLKSPPNHSQWLCIHRYERDPAQGWATRTGNGYYGGLQMDMDFQRSYGSYLLKLKGTANNWTALEQIWTAERARASGRGFYPWPNTARTCGLI